MNKLTVHRHSMFVLLGLLGAVTACETKKADATTTGSAAISPSAPILAAHGNDSNTTAKVTNIVFVSKEHPCDCTRKKIDTAQAALQQLLGSPPRIPLQTLKADIEPEKLEPYRQQRPMMALPAIYFVDGKNAVVELLQGEITAEQISNALNAHNS